MKMIEIGSTGNLSQQLLEIFDDKENPEIQTGQREVEAKLFIKGKNKEELKEIHKKIQEKLINNFSGKEIFNGELEDTRYYDNKKKKKSKLLNDGIYLVRIRKEKGIYNGKIDKKNILTIKKEAENKTAIEYEKEVDSDFGKKLEDDFGLKKIKVSRKKRKEFEIIINEKKVKIAFDEYLAKNENDSDIYEDNSSVVPYFEVEAEDEETRAEAITQIKNLFPDLNFLVGETGIKKIKKQQTKEKFKDYLEKEFDDEYSKKRSYIIKMLSQILDYNSIYSEIGDYINNNKNDLESADGYEKLEKFLRRIIKLSIKNSIKENPKNVILFYRILDEETIKNIFEKIGEKKEIKLNEINFGKKFNDKFEREYPGYFKGFLNSIVNINIKKDNNIDNNEDLINSINNKLKNFLSALLLFDDNLTKSELKQFLSKTTPAQKNKFNTFEQKVGQLVKILSENLNNEKGDKEEILKKISNFINIYRSGIRGVAFGKNLNSSEEGADIIAENLEKTIGEVFAFLVHNFSIWLNVYQTQQNYIKNFLELKKLFEEILYYIFLFREIDIFDNDKYGYNAYLTDDFKKKIQKIYEEKLFNDKNFLIPKNEKKLFKDFFNSLFLDSKDNDILKYKEKYFSNYQKELKEILEKINTNKDNNENIEKKLNNLEDNEINYELWEKLNPDLRLKVFLEKVYYKKDGENAKFNSALFKENIDENEKDFKEFIEEEFEKKYGFKKDDNIKLFGEYYIDTKKQFNKSIRNFESRDNLDNLLEYIETNVNDFHLIVSWFHFGLRKKHLENNKDLQLKDLKLNIPSFEEKVVAKLQEKNLIGLYKNGELTGSLKNKLITTSSDTYTSIFWNDTLFKRLFNRITNGKAINLSNNYSIEDKYGNKQNLKNIYGFYFPKGIDNKKDNFNEVEEYVDAGFNIIRKLYNGEKIEEKTLTDKEKEYYQFINDYNGNFKERDYKTILEFLKFIKKETFYIIKNQHKNSIEDTKFLLDNYKNNNKFIENLGEGVENFNSEEDIIIGGTKSKVGALRKGVGKYGGKYEKIGDKVRMTILGDSEEDLANLVANFIENSDSKNVVGFRFEDNIGNIFKKAKRANGYRDAKLILELNNGNTVEVQFQLKDYYKVKHTGIQINDELAKILNPVGSKIEFNEEEKNQIINFYKNTNEKIPKDFAKIFLGFEDNDLKKEEYKDIFSDQVNFSADFTYRLERAIGNKSIIDKFYEIDKRLFDLYAGGKIAKKEIERVMKKFEK